MLVALDGENVVGFTQLLVTATDIVVDLIAVDPAHRGRGHAGRMLARAQGVFPGRAVLRAGTQTANIASLRLYTRHGFLPAGAWHVLHFNS